MGTFKATHNDIGILLPAAVISATGVASLGPGRHVAMATVACFVGLQIAVFTLPASSLAARTGTFGWAGDGYPGVHACPRTEDWRVESVLRSVATRPVRVAVVSDHIFINGATVDFYRMRNDLPAEVTPCWRLGREARSLGFSRFDMVSRNPTMRGSNAKPRDASVAEWPRNTARSSGDWKTLR